ncbi:MAG: methyltransferase domain-containing protein [Dehalococcoidia bacterium]
MTSPWDPNQYHRFRDERAQPFHDLLDLCQPIPGGRAVDLGCGTGELTRLMHDHLSPAETVGIDSSATMLAEAAAHAGAGLRFEQHDIASFADAAGFDLVYSNAALQWVDDHPALIPRLAALVRPGGQFAFQVPANHDHVSHRLAHEIAAEEPFAAALGGYVRGVPVMLPEWYAAALDRLGFAPQRVLLEVYGHHLEGPEGVIEWVKGTLLTDYKRRLPGPLYEDYLARYRERLLARLDGARPYFYPFKRILAWGRKGGGT